MIGILVGIIIALIIIGVIWWGATQIIAVIPMAEPIKTVVSVLVIVVLVLAIIIYVLVPLLGMAGIHVPLSLGR